MHPAKAEVRFYDNALVRGLLVSAIRHALNEGSGRTSSTLSLADIVQDKIPDFDNLPPRADLGEPVLPQRSFQYQGSYGGGSRRQAVLPELERNFSVKAEPEREYLPEDTATVGPLGLGKIL